MKDTFSGDTLMSKINRDPTGTLTGIDTPEPVFTCSIECESSSAQKDFERALSCMQKEDPSIRVTVDEETGQTLLSGR